MAKILVVDDRASNRDILTTLLGYRGHRVSEATNGTDALDKVHTDPPDLIITDLLMPGMDGFEFVRNLHRTGTSEHSCHISHSNVSRRGGPRSIQSALLKPKPAVR